MCRNMNRTYRELFIQAVQELTDAGVPEPSADTWILFEAAFQIGRGAYYMNPDGIPQEEKIQRFRKLVEQRRKRIPVQYITGEQEFMGLSFRVTPAVLVPRQDTEILVDTVLHRIGERTVQVLDLCTGSGCIAVSLAKLAANAVVTAADISTEALAVAAENGKRNNVEVCFVESDLFSGVEGLFDVIVSNPPYIPSADILDLEPEVKEHEPMLALDGTADGLFFYRQIVRQAVSHLREAGILAFEIGYNQAEAVTQMMEEAGFSDIQVIKDLAGLDRVVIGTI